VTMSLKRRLALLEWAARVDAWVIEDDYDSEFRYTGRPLASAQGIDLAGRVIYTGAFNKVMFPALRLAYLVAPVDLTGEITASRTLSDMPPGSVKGLQLVVSDINAARAALVKRGVDVSDVQVFDWGSFVFFSDPDGNGWAVQQIPARK